MRTYAPLMSAPSSRRSSTKRAAATLSVITAMVIAPAFFQAAVGRTDPGSPPGKGKPGTLQAAPAAAPDCDLTAGDGPKDEFADCATVAVSAGSTPAVGATTTIDVAVQSVKDLSGATLSIGVNDVFDVVTSTGFADAGTKASGVGTLTVVSRSVDVTAGQTAHFSIDVTGTKGGTGVVQARLDAKNDQYSNSDELDVQLGASAPTPPGGLATARVPASAHIATHHWRSHLKPPSLGKKPAAQLDPSTPGASCATGGWFFYDETSTLQPSYNFVYQVWDQDPGGTDDLLASGYTAGNGTYSSCFESTESDGDGGGQEVYIKFISSNPAWRVRNTAASNQNYVWNSGVFAYPDPGSHDFGSLIPGDTTLHRALHAYDAANRIYQWRGGYLDNAGENRQLVINWTNTSTDGTYYSTATKDVHLAAADPDADHTTIHEAAHAMMDALYDDDWPPVTNCNPHYIFGTSSATCAWTEGFAEWVPARVLDDPFFRWPNGDSLDLENEGWTTYPSAYGDTAEGRVAGALIDLSDGNNDAPWDRYAESTGYGAANEPIFATLNAKQVSDTFSEYFNTDRTAEGDQGYFARAAVFQNTIDYTSRDPLTSTVELTRPALNVQPNPHNYSFSFTNNFWTAVAIRTNGTDDNDLRVYSDEGLTTQVAASTYGGTFVDYVVIDGNHRTGTYFPRALYYSGSGSPYTIEEYTGQYVTPLGPEALSFGAGDIVQPLDLGVSAGQTEYIGVVPDAGLGVSVQTFESDGTQAGSVLGRPDFTASSGVGGAGTPVYLQYTPAADGFDGLVVVNENGVAGNYTLYRDDAVPTGTVTIDGGTTQTYDTSVDLTLAATPASTPVTQMQISTDGTFDSEPWVAYSTSATATVPGGLGTKTVSVRYRSAAGAISATATDTIDLVTPPKCNGLTATIAGTGSVTGTPGNDVIVGGPGADAITGAGGNDIICGLNGNDVINDGPGADTVYAGGGTDVINQPATPDAGDVLDGGSGVDQVSYLARSTALTVTLDDNSNDGAAGEGDNVTSTVENVTGGTAGDTLTGSVANNRLIGGNGSGNDTLNGGGGNDYLSGGDGNDTLRGGDNTDTLLGGNGDDTVDEGTAANGTDLIKGGAGFNKIDYSGRTTAVTISLTGAPNSGAAGENDKIIAFQWALGGSAGDTIVGHTTNDVLTGNGGDDHLNGNGGQDTIYGGPGADVLNGGNGNDTLDTIDGVNGNDTANGAAGTDTATTDPGDIRISIP